VFGLLGFLLTEGSLGCRYNVRETGFVDTGPQPFVLVCFVNEQTSQSLGARFLRAAETALVDSNVTFELVDIDYQPEHPAVAYLGDMSRYSLPCLVLISPERSTRFAPIELKINESSSDLKKRLRRIVNTPFLERLADLLSKHYAIVLLVHSSDVALNLRRESSVRNALGRIQRQMKFMPKVIRHGPTLMVLDADTQPLEGTLLWSLGITDALGSGPYAAVVYGKGRWLGPLLQNEEIEAERLTQLLAIVGADCECGLDPRLMRGRALPLRWDRAIHTQLVNDLGFDPENPMVRMEVSQIMRMRASLYPEKITQRNLAGRDDLPIPFVEDLAEEQSVGVLRNPVAGSILFSVAGLGILAIVVGLFIMMKAKRNS
jgi:hypothetical protein